jgi:hypothetical protein
MSLFVWYFGTKKKYPEIPHHMMLLGERYKTLLDDIFKKHHLAKDFSLYLHRPTATDPSMAPEGCDTFYVLSPVPHLDSGTDWQTTAESYRQGIANMLEDIVGKRFIRFGKPDVPLFIYAYEKLSAIKSIPKDKILMVGDTLHTDILGGNKFGIHTALVLSGNTLPEQHHFLINSSGIIPDYVCHSVAL